jgi:hypothetical protein
VELHSELEDLGIPNLQKTGNKQNTMSKQIKIPINIQKECLKMLKGLNPCNASSTLLATSPGWIMGSLLFWISKISLCKAIKSMLKSVWDQTPCR